MARGTPSHLSNLFPNICGSVVPEDRVIGANLQVTYHIRIQTFTCKNEEQSLPKYRKRYVAGPLLNAVLRDGKGNYVMTLVKYWLGSPVDS